MNTKWRVPALTLEPGSLNPWLCHWWWQQAYCKTIKQSCIHTWVLLYQGYHNSTTVLRLQWRTVWMTNNLHIFNIFRYKFPCKIKIAYCKFVISICIQKMTGFHRLLIENIERTQVIINSLLISSSYLIIDQVSLIEHTVAQFFPKFSGWKILKLMIESNVLLTLWYIWIFDIYFKTFQWVVLRE